MKSELKEEYGDEVLENKDEIMEPYKPSEPKSICRVCTICQEVLSNSFALLDHSIKVHNEHKPFNCQLCDYKADTLYKLRKHKDNKHVKTAIYACTECEKSFKEYRTLEYHRVTKHNVEGTQNIVCQCCGEVFKTVKHYHYHKRSTRQTPVDPVACTVCGKIMKNNAKLLLHMKTTHPTETFTCEYCGKVSKTKWALKNHQILGCSKNTKANIVDVKVQQEELLSQESELCKACAKYVKNLRLHILNEHSRVIIENGLEMFQCIFCDKSFGRKSSLSHHLLLHTGKPVYKCDICGIEYKEKRSLTKHLEASHGVEPTNRKVLAENGPFKCDQCEFTTEVKKKLDRHLVCHGDKQYQCDLCDFATAYKSNLLIHKGKTHEKEKFTSVTQNQSTEKFKTESIKKTDPLVNIEDDIKNESDEDVNIKQEIDDDMYELFEQDLEVNEKEYKFDDSEEKFVQNKATSPCGTFCEVCKKNFNTRFELNTHISNNHEIREDEKIGLTKKETEFHSIFGNRDNIHNDSAEQQANNYEKKKSDHPCPFCNMVLETSKKLSDHKQYYHKPENVKCDECGNSFDCRKKLLNHKNRFHSNPVQCDECGEEFKLKYMLRRHIIRYHQIGKDMYPCETCGEKFDRKDLVQMHKRRKHNKISCEHCGESFRDTQYLTVHQMRQHGIDRSEKNFCETCNQSYVNLPKHHFEKHRVMWCPCPQCGKLIGSEYRLKRHIIHNHVEFVCPSTRDMVIAALQHNGVPEDKWPGPEEDIIKFCMASEKKDLS